MAWEPLGQPGAGPHRKWSRTDCTEHTSRAAGKLPQVVQQDSHCQSVLQPERSLYFKRHHLLSTFCTAKHSLQNIHVLQFSLASVSGWLPQFVNDLPHSIRHVHFLLQKAASRCCSAPQVHAANQIKPFGNVPGESSNQGKPTYVSAERSLSLGGGEIFRYNDAVAQSFPVFSLRILLTRPQMSARM